MITVEAYDMGLNYIGLVSSRSEPAFTEQLIQFGDGVGTFKIPASAPELARWSHLLDYGNIIVTHDTNTGYYWPWILEKRNRTYISSNEAGGDVITCSGRSAVALLQDAVVLSEAWAINKPSTDERVTSFASKVSYWYNALDWHTPSGVLWTSDTNVVRRRKPRGWPDNQAYLIWDSSATADLGPGTVYFRTTLTITTASRCSIFCTADNGFDLYVDGEPVMSGNNYSAFQRFDVDFGVGDHIIAVKGKNYSGPAGILLTVWTSDATTGKLITPIRRSNPTSQWACTTLGADAPGWDYGDILATFLLEGKNRGVNTAYAKLLAAWLSNSDSAGQPWDAAMRQIRKFQIGMSVLDVARQLAEGGACDVRSRWTQGADVDHRLKLQVFKHMGTDRTIGANNPSGKAIILQKALNATNVTYDGDNSGTQTTLIVKTDKGWNEFVSATYGAVRREGFLSLGSSEDDAQSLAVATSAFELVGKAQETVQAQAIPVTGHIPFQDFFVGDDVYVQDSSGALVKSRVVGLTLGEDSAGTISYTPEFSTIPVNRITRATRWLKSMVPGALGGRLTSASLASLPPTVGPNLGNVYEIPFSFDGPIAASISPKYVPRDDGTLTELYCTLATAGSTTTTAYTVKNGVQTDLITFTAGQTEEIVVVQDYYVDTDSLQIQVVTPGTGAANLVVQARFS